MRRSFESEVAMLQVVREWLASQEFEVYQEVNHCDVVAKRGALVWAIEGKLQSSFAVLDQALRWRGSAHEVYVAVPYAIACGIFARCAQKFGIGVIAVRPAESWRKSEVELVCRSTFLRRIDRKLLGSLRDEHKDFTQAGSNSGQRWTAWRETCKALRIYVEVHPGCSLKDAIKNTKHHYQTGASAIGAMRKWIDLGRVDGIRSEKDGRLIKLFPANGTTVPHIGDVQTTGDMR